MTVSLATTLDFTIDHYAAVAWRGSDVSISPETIDAIDHHRRCFLQLLEDNPELNVYGVTSGYGQNASKRLTLEEMQKHALSPPYASMSGFGGDLPDRIKRGIVFTRLTNFIGGNSAVSGDLVQRVADLLNHPLPNVPSIGNSSAGEIVPLSHLFASIWDTHSLGIKEALSLINGSPCASALMADVVLSTRRRLNVLLEVFALSAEAMQAPAEHYAAELDVLHNDPHQSQVRKDLRRLMDITDSADNRRPYQAPVSWRIVPRVLGFAFQALDQLERSTELSLQSVTDNPVYVTSNQDHPLGQVMSNGGYHNAMICPLLDQITGCFADLALLCDKQCSKLFDTNVSRLPSMLQTGDGYAGVLGFIAADYADQAHGHAQRTGMIASEGGGFGQNDVSIPVFRAWRKVEDAGICLDACSAVLCITASQAFHATSDLNCSRVLVPLLDRVRSVVPPLSTARPLGPEAGQLAEMFTQAVYD